MSSPSTPVASKTPSVPTSPAASEKTPSDVSSNLLLVPLKNKVEDEPHSPIPKKSKETDEAKKVVEMPDFPAIIHAFNDFPLSEIIGEGQFKVVNISHQPASNEKFKFTTMCLGDSEGRTSHLNLHGKKAVAAAKLKEFDILLLSNFQMKSAKKLDEIDNSSDLLFDLSESSTICRNDQMSKVNLAADDEKIHDKLENLISKNGNHCTLRYVSILSDMDTQTHAGTALHVSHPLFETSDGKRVQLTVYDKKPELETMQLYRIVGTKCKKPFNASSSDVDLSPKMHFEVEFKMIVDKTSKPTLVTLNDLFDIVNGERISMSEYIRGHAERTDIFDGAVENDRLLLLRIQLPSSVEIVHDKLYKVTGVLLERGIVSTPSRRTEPTTPRSTRSRIRARQLSMDSDNIEDRTEPTTPSRSTRSRTRARQLSVDTANIEDRTEPTPSRSTRSQTRARQLTMDSDNIEDSPTEQQSVSNIAPSTRFRTSSRQVSIEDNRVDDSRSRAMDMRYHREQETTSERTHLLQLDAEKHRRYRQRSHVEVQMTARQNTNLPRLHYIGTMSLPCISCGALHFNEETHRPDHSFNVCCNFGKVTVPVFQNYPEQWKTYLTSMEGQYTGFRQNIRNLNSALAMASMGAQLDIPDNRKNRGPYCFRIHGQIYHHIGPLHPPEGQQLSYGQIYILDTDMAAEERLRKKDNTKCDPALMEELGVFLSRHNPYAQSYFMMSEIEKREEENARQEGRSADPVRLIFDTSLPVDKRRYNLPAANEVAIVFVGKDDDVPPTRSLAVHSRSEGLQIIQDIDKLCDPLTYPILYPTGGFGWHPQLMKTTSSEHRTRITQKEYYCYLLHTRTGEFNPLHHCNKLFQQFIVDSWVKTEQNRLNYDRQHQSDLRIDSYKGLQDYMGEDNQEQGPPGRRIVLPASYKGGPRDMQQSYQDSMAIVAKYGKPEYFLTMTSNPHWKEITEQLNPGQTASDRPDIVARVFQLKVTKLFDCLLKEHILGEVAAYVAVVEFQKRGLPHIHMLIIMKSDYKLRSARDIDSAISAEFPIKKCNLNCSTLLLPV